MYKVLIVEDEMLVRLGLKNSINWAKYDMMVIADVDDGKKAWEIYKEKKPDIVITDLKMPGLGGMELIKLIRETDKDTYIIIITCLEEFDLVRNAMSMGVSNYIVKITMTEEEIENVLRKAQNELKARKPLKPSSIDFLNQQNRKEELFKKLLVNSLSSSEFAQKAKLWGWNIESLIFSIVLIKFENNGEAEAILEISNHLARQTVLDLLNEFSGLESSREVFYWKDGCYILLFSFDRQSKQQEIVLEIQNVIKRIQKRVETYFNVPVTAAVSRIIDDIKSLKEAYEECCCVLTEDKYLLGPGSILYSNAINRASLVQGIIRPLYSCSEWIRWLNEENDMLYEIMVSQVEKGALQGKKQAQNAMMQLTQWITSHMIKYDADILKLQAECNRTLLYAGTFQQAIDICVDFIKKCHSLYCSFRPYRNEIRKALEMIEKNYDRNLKLPQVAECVGLSANYFSSLFKKETGRNFVEYLMEFRIKKAKWIMKTSPLTLDEISRRCGFSDETYFNRVFHKYEGMSPSTWRHQYQD